MRSPVSTGRRSPRSTSTASSPSLIAPHLPGLKDNLATSFSVDPRYFSGRLRSMDGAAFGLEPRLTQSAYFRYHNKSDDVTNLFFAGASTHPGAGVPGVLCGAKVLEHTLPDLSEAQRIPLPSVSLASPNR